MAQPNHYITNSSNNTKKVVPMQGSLGVDAPANKSKPKAKDNGPSIVSKVVGAIKEGFKEKPVTTAADREREAKYQRDLAKIKEEQKKQAEAKRPAVGTDADAKKKYGSKSWNNGYTN
jgi:lipoate-protein ligase A